MEMISKEKKPARQKVKETSGTLRSVMPNPAVALALAKLVEKDTAKPKKRK
jgi:hypothetical protein